jgi:hypothetical protein
MPCGRRRPKRSSPFQANRLVPAGWNRLAKLAKPELKEMRAEWQSWGLDMKIVLRVQCRVSELFPGLIVSLKGVRRSR